MRTRLVRRVRAAVPLALLVGLPLAAHAATRLNSAIDGASRYTLAGSLDPHVRSSQDLGPMDPTARLEGVSLNFKPSASQQAALKALLQAQRTPGSPDYHRWLTPEQYAARFGMSQADLDRVGNWLAAQGLSVTGVSRSHNRISFSGTVAQIDSAFGASLHHFRRDGNAHFASATALHLPAALQDSVQSVRNLDDFRLKPRHIVQGTAHPELTTSQGSHFLVPNDVATIYDVAPVYAAGFTGSGHTLAVVGQTLILNSDIKAFRSAAGLSDTTPTYALVPGSGIAVISSGDIDEASLDVEWSGAMARDASIVYVYTGSSKSYGVFDALQYAIDNDVAPVISISYGNCEANFSSSDLDTLAGWGDQANAQGQTIVAAAGDSGATDCDYGATVATQGLAVDIPAALPEVTGIGGTQFYGDVSSPDTYWSSANDSGFGSALSYIPETVWNESVSYGSLASGGGGVSTYFSKPSWQAGNGVPSDGMRDVPDISFTAAVLHDGYLLCVQGNCTNGFADSSGNITYAGGTSFGAPVFAGLLTVLEHVINSNGEGNFNPTLYSLAADSTTYTQAFHDVTTGSNAQPCTAGTTDCPSGGSIGYSASTGYDLASGLGSLDIYQFSKALPNSALNVINTTVAVTAGTIPVPINTATTFTAVITPLNVGTTEPSGTVDFLVDGVSAAQVAVSNYSASYTITFDSPGSHHIVASYSGDSGYGASTSSTLSVNVVTQTSGSKSGGGGAFGLPALLGLAGLALVRHRRR